MSRPPPLPRPDVASPGLIVGHGQVSYYREALAWTNEDIAAMLPVFPNLLSIKMENDVIEVVDYLR